MKKRIILIISLLSAIVCQAQYRTADYRDLDDSEMVSSIKNHVSYLSAVALEGRAAGSEGEAEAAAYVAGALSSYGVELLSGSDGDIFGMKRPDGDTLVSRNVIGCIQGYDPALRDHYIVIGARLDNIGTRTVTVDGRSVTKTYCGANGNASGLAAMLELAKMLRTNSILLKRSVLFVAFGASLESNAGSWYFLNRSFKDADKIDAMINLDILGTGSSGFYAFTSSNADMNMLLKSMGATLQPVQPAVTALEPLPSDHRTFYDKGIVSVFFTTGVYPEYGTDRDTASIIEYDMMEREIEYIYNFTISLVNGPKPVFNPSEQLASSVGKKDSGAIPYYECDWPPTFLGSSDPKVFLQKWVYAYLKYPPEAVRNGIQGRVQVDFIIDERGKVKSVKVLRGVDELLDREAVRVIEASPDWKPARLGGKKVASEMSLYVDFILEKKKNR